MYCGCQWSQPQYIYEQHANDLDHNTFTKNTPILPKSIQICYRRKYMELLIFELPYIIEFYWATKLHIYP